MNPHMQGETLPTTHGVSWKTNYTITVFPLIEAPGLY